MFHLAISFMFSSLNKHVSNYVNSKEGHKGLAPTVSPMGNKRNFKKKGNCSLTVKRMGSLQAQRHTNPEGEKQYFLFSSLL